MTFLMPESSSHPPLIYKICPPQEWRTAEKIYLGSFDDQRDGFIHFSSAAQLIGTLNKHYAGQNELILLEFEAHSFGAALKWEVSGSGQTFPHLYGALDKDDVQRQWTLSRQDGKFELPQDLGGTS